MRADADWLLTAEEMNKALGAEVRRARDKMGLTRPELVARLPFTISDASLLNWELGHRSISYHWLVEVARTLNTTAPELLRRAVEHVEAIQTTFVELELKPLVEDTDQRFDLVRTWARNKLATITDNASHVRVHHSVVRELAVLTGVHVTDLARYLTATASMTQSCGDQPVDD